MQNKKLSLRAIANNFDDEDVVLKIQRGKVNVVINNPTSHHVIRNRSQISNKSNNNAPSYSNHANMNNVGLFSKLAKVNKNKSYENIENKNKNTIDQQFVIKPKSRSKIHRTSLADLGQIYSNSRLAQNTNKSRRLSQNFTQTDPKLNMNYVSATNRYANNSSGNKNQIYEGSNNSKLKIHSDIKPSHSQYRRALQQVSNNNNNESNSYKYMTAPTEGKNGLYSHSGSKKSKKNTEQANNGYTNGNKYDQQQQYYSGRNQCYYGLKQKNGGLLNKQQEQMQKIKQSIKQIKLPYNKHQCPKYEEASDKFQKMKRQILQKIIDSGQINEYSDILKQINQAAQQIITRHHLHIQEPPILKKQGSSHGTFSFKDIHPSQSELQIKPINLFQSPSNLMYSNTMTIKEELNPIVQQALGKSQINLDSPVILPQFKDDCGSISSILSANAAGKSKDYQNSQNQSITIRQVTNKIDNVFICDNILAGIEQNSPAEPSQKLESSSNSIKPIVLEQNEDQKTQNYIDQIRKQVKILLNQQAEQSLKVKNTFIQQNYNYFEGQNKKQQQKRQEPKSITQLNEELKHQIISDNKSHIDKQHAYIFARKYQIPTRPQIKPIQVRNASFKKRQFDSQLIPGVPLNQNYHLQRLTEHPVPIIQNLQQAKLFDPEVTKFTELKLQYIQTRTKAPEIIRIPSPLRFRRKQEVVQCLVKNHIVERQSNSIQF